MAIICENDAGTQHHTVFDRNGAADVHERIDLYPISNYYIRRDVTLFSNDALFTNPCGVTDVNVVPDRSAFANLYIALYNRCGMNAY
ncbi:MAG: hypothetical protein WA715_18935 [Candidatus Acidiferrum sp.]